MKQQPIAVVMEPAEQMVLVNVTVNFSKLIVQVSYNVFIILRFRGRFTYFLYICLSIFLEGYELEGSTYSLHAVSQASSSSLKFKVDEQ